MNIGTRLGKLERRVAEEGITCRACGGKIRPDGPAQPMLPVVIQEADGTVVDPTPRCAACAHPLGHDGRASEEASFGRVNVVTMLTRACHEAILGR
ncbi:MAG: hypothetical protein ACKVS8_10955 [Phycisphaerales bacterium]